MVHNFTSLTTMCQIPCSNKVQRKLYPLSVMTCLHDHVRTLHNPANALSDMVFFHLHDSVPRQT